MSLDQIGCCLTAVMRQMDDKSMDIELGAGVTFTGILNFVVDRGISIYTHLFAIYYVVHGDHR